MATPFSVIDTSKFIETGSDAILNDLSLNEVNASGTINAYNIGVGGEIPEQIGDVKSIRTVTDQLRGITNSIYLTNSDEGASIRIRQNMLLKAQDFHWDTTGTPNPVEKMILKNNGDLEFVGNLKNKGFETFTFTDNTLFLKLLQYSGSAFKIRSYTASGVGNNNVTVYASHFNSSSDDRQKAEETLITNATETIKKLKPQVYKKYGNFDLSGDYVIESGLISQEVYYNAPELRHLVDTGNDASGNPVIPSEMDLSNVNIGEDPDYEAHGWTDGAGLNYDGLIAYLIKSNQELEARISALEN